MLDPTSPGAVRDLLQRHGFRIKKNLGQNFLIDGNIINKIIIAAELNSTDTVVEIGPGVGALTTRLAQKAERVIAIEIDRTVLPLLAETLDGLDNVTLVEADALKTDINRLVQDQTGTLAGGYKVVANLPYYITTPLIMHLLERHTAAQRIVVMVQEEVARRLCASPGTKDYGALTVTANYYAVVKTAFKVPRTVFLPRPEVDSAVVSMTVRKSPAVDVVNEQVFFALVRAAFQQRRKTLLNALVSMDKGLSRDRWLDILQQAGINPVRRGETLNLQEFARLADAYANLR
ncbi:16S rRNA (adenine(1518)-N(6)/adenine(1519)-N(6))-dimethyltransferase RsmA [Desulfallas thermosapovorans]|uniref:Ribosomal RNA small subunit methyltransferase A n=1 Tax=Desulfallas thermosapovorans DSM 6562 TaxID=1121431 RepID=A0A5S4ZXN0_9FIRM|nr:16S rRNA (adenine(1518)-N(6)/adenine(1519)-N(6))-dimethyltransferase RsmA [Desulfallas thermosapovorans]TYO97000.1 dimethyladenosine transferase [Desulfallas thermosapovorans DSM 6562]